MKSPAEELIIGKRNVMEAILSGNVIKVLFVKSKQPKYDKILEEARARNIPVLETNTLEFAQMVTKWSSQKAHQGIAALVESYSYVPWDDLLDKVSHSAERDIILLLDHLQDPHNLGALLRTAESAGVKHLVIPKKRSVQVNATVRKVAAGAAEWVSVSRVSNLVNTIKELKDRGFWIYGASSSGSTPYYQADWKRKVGLVLGSEEKGISRLVGENCDELLYIPMTGNISSLNVSVGGALFMYEFRRNQEGW